MKKLLLFLCLAALLIAACKKDKDAIKSSNVFIEKRLRLDTIDFGTSNGQYGLNELSMFKFMSAGVSYPILYRYKFKNDSIYLENMLSSAYFGDVPQYFQWGANKNSFKIKKFFERDALPDIVEFVKLK